MILNFFKTKNKLFEKDCKITYQYDGLITLEFEKDEEEEVLCEEPFFISNENQFIVKNIDENTITCELDFTSLKKDFFVGEKKFDSLTLNDILHQLLDKVNWTIRNAQSIKSRRTLEVEDESLLSAIFKLEKLYDCTFEFDCKNKILTVVDEGRKRDYNISKDINLEDFIIKKDTFEHYTRIYGFGKNNMTFESINGGKEYVENTKYNQNIIPAVFRDDRFTDKLNLKKHCEELLEKYSNPLIEYELSIVELDGIKLKLHDIVTFLNHKTKRKEEHRIIEYTRYTEDETKSEIKFINRATNLSEFITHQQDTITTEIQKEIGKYDFKTKFDEDIKKATERFEKLLLFGHKIETENGVYYVDQLPKENAKNVLRIGLGGIMGSSTGWNGTYSLAISNDGVINADRILTGFLDADRIKANSITADKLTVKAKEEITDGLIKKENFNNFLVNNQVLKSKITESVTNEISKVKVGARNLLRNSSTLDKIKWQKWSATNIEYIEITDNDEWRDNQAIKFLGIDNAITSKVRGYYLLDTVKFEKDKTYTLSFDVINLSDFDINFAVDKVKLSKKVEVKAKENKRVDITFNRKDFDEIMIAVETELNQNPIFCVKNVKVEEGNKATSWTPAIEDLEEIDKQLSNAIEYLSSDNKDLLKKYEGLNLENAKIRHQLSTVLKQTKDEFLFQFNNYKQLLDKTGKVMEQRFNDFSRYIRFKAGNVELGDINSPFKTLITHEKIGFLKGSVEVAYMSNNKLYITDAYVINSLRIGNFEFSVQENGNLSFRKVVD